MAFQWAGRADDTMAWIWDNTGVQTDNFRKAYSPVERGGPETRELGIYPGATTWVKGQLLNYGTPGDGYYYYVPAGGGAATAVACTDVTNGVSALDFDNFKVPPRAQGIWLRTGDYWAAPDKDDTQPTTNHIGDEVGFHSDNLTWDLNGSLGGIVVEIDVDRKLFICQLNAGYSDPPPLVVP